MVGTLLVLCIWSLGVVQLALRGLKVFIANKEKELVIAA
jgi:hypothetical protein